MINYKLITNSEEETKNFSKNLASKLNIGDIIVLTGELGSGKTKFTEGFLSYFNLENEISSPTFTIVNEYISDKIRIAHFDVYRLESCEEFFEIGGEEYFKNSICIIEWGEIIEKILPENFIKISFVKDIENENSRKLYITTFGNKYDKIFL